MIIIDFDTARDVRAYTELVLNSIMFVYIVGTYFRLWKLKKVKFITILLLILAIYAIQGIYSGFYWSSYFPGPTSRLSLLISASKPVYCQARTQKITQKNLTPSI